MFTYLCPRWFQKTFFFLGKMDDLIQFIVRDIKYRQGYDIWTFKAALLLIGDISKVVSKAILKYSFLTEVLLDNLSSDDIQRSVKPLLLSILADLIFTMGTSYMYKDLKCKMLSEILRLDRKLDILFVADLKRSSMVLLNSLLVTFEKEVDEGLILSYIECILEEDERRNSTSQLLDLGYGYVSIFGKKKLHLIEKIILKGKEAKIDKTETLVNIIK